MTTFVAGLSFKTAPVQLREQLAVHPSKLRCCACRLKIHGDLDEVVLLSTCNRVEIYGVARRSNGLESLFEHLSHGTTDFSEYVYVKTGVNALRHLFSVASGLDSMVLGETEITGQVKNAYATAKEARLTGRVLNRVFQTALQTVKDVRTHTGIGRGATSVGSVAVELAEKIFDRNFAEKTVMIIGAGKMGEACVRHLAKRGAKSILVSNRSIERAEALAQEFGGRAIRFDDCFSAMTEADIVVSSTGAPQVVLHAEQIARAMKVRKNRPLVLVDIAVPRDIDPCAQFLENVYLYNIDDLQTLVRENVRLREQELAECQNIIEERIAAVMAKLNNVPEKNYEPRRTNGWVYGDLTTCAG